MKWNQLSKSARTNIITLLVIAVVVFIMCVPTYREGECTLTIRNGISYELDLKDVKKTELEDGDVIYKIRCANKENTASVRLTFRLKEDGKDYTIRCDCPLIEINGEKYYMTREVRNWDYFSFRCDEDSMYFHLLNLPYNDRLQASISFELRVKNSKLV